MLLQVWAPPPCHCASCNVTVEACAGCNGTHEFAFEAWSLPTGCIKDFALDRKSSVAEIQGLQSISRPDSEGFAIRASPFGPCSSTCGGGFVERQLTCVSTAMGTSAPLDLCEKSATSNPDGMDADSRWQVCAAEACAQTAWRLGTFGRSSAQCGCGMRERSASCTTQAGAIAPNSECGALSTALMLQSNTLGCWNAGWVTSAWSECSAQCAGGTMTRTAACVDTTGSTVAARFCPSPRPAMLQECNTQACYNPDAGLPGWFFRRRLQGAAAERIMLDSATQSAALGDAMHSVVGRSLQQVAVTEQAPGAPYFHTACNAMSCSSHGACKSGYCDCDDGYSGDRCHFYTECSGFVQADGTCCTSGYADRYGACCPLGALVDRDGVCCASGIVDACGVCGGNGVVTDVLGECCAGVLDAAGVCCESATLDDCGVCDGDHASCTKHLELDILFDSAAAALTVFQEDQVNRDFKCVTILCCQC